MKRKIKKGTVIGIHQMLDGAKCPGTSARKTMFKAMFPMKAVADGFDVYRDEAVKRLRPDNYDEVAGLVQKFAAMDADAQKAAINEPLYKDALTANYEFNTALNQCLGEERDKDVELDFAPLTDEVFDTLCDANPDWTLGQCMELRDVLCGEPNEEGGKA